MVQVKNFLNIFAKNGQSYFALVLVLVLESKGPYFERGIKLRVHELMATAVLNERKEKCTLPQTINLISPYLKNF